MLTFILVKRLETKFPCTLCDKIYQHKSSLDKHVKTKHGKLINVNGRFDVLTVINSINYTILFSF